ncbi:class I SAM-dependent methyltransferase [Natronococcus sp. A-GB7]|uniref:class I SAM-dependent methyltransferase n=1 Tax=Natronococcus sp. A-GB7 TaxID=3037649 RepID=UPI00241CBA0F|nr:class I SAM-dependent methyltransferase [Natronococcus sp. A-GB7]MDG5821745.1 class I SAM-dependent methyltransferase [Natronococcus sp. A-GB7]
MSMPASVDMASIWAQAIESGAIDRWAPDADRDYWQTHGDAYDDRFPDGPPEGFDAVAEATAEARTALEIGPGTGRYTMRLAPQVEQMTVVDYAPSMLDRLQTRLTNQGIDGVTCREGRWPAVGAAPHDLVLAAWTTYSQREIDAALDAMVAATRRRLVIVDSAGVAPPHTKLLAAVCGDDPPDPAPRALYVVSYLWETGVRASLTVDSARRCYEADSSQSIATQLAPEANPATISTLADRLDDHLEPTAEGVRYQYEIPAGVVVWDPTDESLAEGSSGDGRSDATESGGPD